MFKGQDSKVDMQSAFCGRTNFSAAAVVAAAVVADPHLNIYIDMPMHRLHMGLVATARVCRERKVETPNTRV